MGSKTSTPSTISFEYFPVDGAKVIQLEILYLLISNVGTDIVLKSKTAENENVKGTVLKQF